MVQHHQHNHFSQTALYPLSLIAIQVISNAVIVGFTAPFSTLRIATLPIIISCVSLTIPACLRTTGRTLWAALLGAHSASFLLQYIETALLSRWNFDSLGPLETTTVTKEEDSDPPRAKTRRNGSLLQRLRFGLWAASSTRNVRTRFQVKNVPPFVRKDPSFIPSRAQFLRGKVITVILCYLTLDLLTLKPSTEETAVIFSAANVPVLDRNNLSVEKLIIRAASSLAFWTSLYCIIELYMSSVALIAVGTGLSEVKYWPPGYGSLRDAYTIRRFWR